MQKLPLGLAGSGLVLLVFAVVAGWVVVPNIVDEQISKQVQLTNGSETWDKWSDIPLPVYLKFFIFNVTNPLEVERGGKPRLQECGPYVYREKRRKVDLSISEDGDVIRYRQPVDYFFEPAMSAGSEDDVVNIINIPFVAVGSKAKEIPFTLQFLFNFYVQRFEETETLFIEKKVREILFEGYYEPMMAEIQYILGEEKLKDNKFGLYYPTVGSLVGQISQELANLIVNILRVVSLGSESFVRRRVRVGDLTFRGMPVPFYTIPLQIISNLAPSLNVTVPELPPEFGGGRFGFYNGRNQSDDGIFEIHSGVKDATKFGNIITHNNKTKLDWWVQSPGDYCNMINGTDGSIFPPFIKKDRILRIFNADICRSLYLTYNDETEFMGIPGYRFTAPKGMLESPLINEDNLCFCPNPGKDNSECLKAGALDLSTCREGAPVAMSLPHFLDGEPEYLSQTIGLSPNFAEHGTYLDVEPNSGLVMQAHKRIQINVQLKKMPFIDAFKDVPEMLFPVLWADEYATLDDENAKEVKRLLITPLRIVSITAWAVLGLSYLLIAAGGAICFRRMRKQHYHTVMS